VLDAVELVRVARGEAGVVGAFSIAAKLDRLFRQVRAAGQAEPSYMAVAEAIRARQGVPISHTYIWQLRTGRRDNPTIQHLTALATYFGVPGSTTSCGCCRASATPGSPRSRCAPRTCHRAAARRSAS
jgi:transcriptional regulator with XRE-family HTH domain